MKNIKRSIITTRRNSEWFETKRKWEISKNEQKDSTTR